MPVIAFAWSRTGAPITLGGMTRPVLVGFALALACGSSRPASQHFDDNYEAARLAAVESKLPLVVEVWAPW